MINLCQRDPRWSNVKLGPSNLTVGRYGCTTTCISMLSDYFGCFTLPSELAKGKHQLGDLLKYTQDGLVIWGSLNLDRMAMERRVFGRNDTLIKESLKDPKKAVILQVNDGAHWVVAIRKEILGSGYVIVDPWDGKQKSSRVYGNITGSAHFIRK